MNNKRKYGQFFTDYNPFENKPFKIWFEKALSFSENKVLEPFAGSNNLIKMLLNEYEFYFESYDIEPKSQEVKKKDTLKDYPKGFKLAITNPPYLSKVSAKRRGINYPSTDFSDLYKFCLNKMLHNHDYVGAIIPISIIRDESFVDRLETYIILNKKMFETTETPVCLALFSPRKTFANTKAFTLEGKIGTLEKINLYIEKEFNSNSKYDIKFNSKKGNLFLRAIDSVKDKKIEFGFRKEMNPDDIKISSRHLTLIDVPFSVDEKSILRLNEILNEYRDKTGDIYLNAFMGLRNDGKYRRRLDYSMARKIIERYIEENEK